MRYILASKSPRRQELLQRIIKNFEIDVVETEEFVNPELPLDKAIEDVAKQKGLAVFKKHPDATVISADTIVAMNGVVYGKPKDEEDAKRMLKELSGEFHDVITAVCLIKEGKCETFSVTSKVKFLPLSDAEICAYVDTKEPLDKAGAYGIQGYGALLIEKIDNDYYTIMGLPISLLNQRLKTF